MNYDQYKLAAPNDLGTCPDCAGEGKVLLCTRCDHKNMLGEKNCNACDWELDKHDDMICDECDGTGVIAL